MTFLFALLTLFASTYISFACFCIVHRMNERTKWSVAIAIITIAGLGAYAFLVSLGYVLGVVATMPPPLVALALSAAFILFVNPRIRTEPEGI